MRSEDTDLKTGQWCGAGSDSAGRVAGLVRALGACALRDTQFRGTASTAVSGRLCSPTLAQLWAASFVRTPDVSHRLGSLCHELVSSRACWPNHRFGMLLGSLGNLRGRPARVRRPAVGSPKELARGNWHASTHGCAVTGARTDGDVGGCLVTRGARKWRLEGVKRGEIVRRNVGIRVLGSER